mgnify:CR=1 FL=1
MIDLEQPLKKRIDRGGWIYRCFRLWVCKCSILRMSCKHMINSDVIIFSPTEDQFFLLNQNHVG